MNGERTGRLSASRHLPPVRGRRAGGVRYTAAVLPAAITFRFDPLLHLGDWAVRWETLAIGGAIFVGLIVAGLLAGRSRLAAHPDDPPSTIGRLRRDDILFIAVGVVPGALIGGRLTYVVLHLDYYSAFPNAIVDPASGGLALSGAVLLGALSGGLVARLFDAPVGRWYRIAAGPMLLVLALGKAAELLGGTGQGLPSDLGWATRYLGPGPWGSLGPDIASIPAQAYEAIGVTVLLVILAAARGLGLFRGRDGRIFTIALAGWAAVRLEVAATWRDPVVLGPFRAEQVIDLGIAALALLAYLALVVRSRRAQRPTTGPVATPGSPPASSPSTGPPPVGQPAVPPAAPELSWPDPDARRRP